MPDVTATISLSSQMRLAVMRLSRRLRQESVGEITQSQLSALATVERSGALSLGELAEIERVAPPSMTRIAARLEERGLFARTADQSDRRIARVAITDEGRQLLAETRTRRDVFLAGRLAALSPEEQQVLLRALPLFERLARDEE
jgi:DNA-binding MarR family transcriptional regulator